MRKRILILPAVGLGLILMTWVAFNFLPQRRPVPANGPVTISLAGRIKITGELSAFQLEGLTQRLAINSHTLVTPVTNMVMIQITNRGRQTVEIWGYNSGSPVYSLYVDGTNGLERLEDAIPKLLSAMVYLGPTQSLSFPVIPPATDRPWHVEVSYRDFVAPTPPPFVRKPPTAFENLVVRTRSLVPSLRMPEPGSYWTMSASIRATEGTNQTVERPGANPLAEQTNRTSSSGGSRR